MDTLSKSIGAILVLLSVCFFGPMAQAKYSGGTGEPNDPYQIATAEDLMLLGDSPEDYDKHFIMTDDIDLDPNLPGRKVFDKAVIAPASDILHPYGGITFEGVFDGNGHMISHLTVEGENGLGLFGKSYGKIVNLGVVDVNVTGGAGVGGLVGYNWGSIVSSYSMSSVSGTSSVGGLVGSNMGEVANCHSTGTVHGGARVGGLVGENGGNVINCYSKSTVTGDCLVGGLAGGNLEVLPILSGVSVYGSIAQCYSAGAVTGNKDVGGLVGANPGDVIDSYSTSAVTGDRSVGGLVGTNLVDSRYPSGGAETFGFVSRCYSIGLVIGNSDVGGLVGLGTTYWVEGSVVHSFWGIETSGQNTSDSGTGKTTAEMQTASTFIEAGWDFVGEIGNGTHEAWQIPEEGGYPLLTTLGGYTPPGLQGIGTVEDPYLIHDALELGSIIYNSHAHYRLAASIDLSGICWDTAVVPQFSGTLDGAGNTISNLTIKGRGYLGLFGKLESGAEIIDLTVVDVNITATEGDVGGLVGQSKGDISSCYSDGYISSTGYYVGGLVGDNWGSVVGSYSSGSVSGNKYVGGLAGANGGSVTQCHSTGAVSGDDYAGSLVGYNNRGSILMSYSSGSVSGNNYVGALVGCNRGSVGSVTQCYSIGSVIGIRCVGGLVGINYQGTITTSYSTSSISGTEWVGGLVGFNRGSVAQCYSTGSVSGGGLVGANMNIYDLGNEGVVSDCFWDTETSGQTTSAGGLGKTTAEMQAASTFLEAGWDFVDETENGTDDIWWILEGQDYPRLWWETHNN
ncbi:MAG: hypothetical protein JXM79_16820 [Sedimentisphaerales bacterium]|nr:hypothetical protein [Sedimentisphaerales bacterium]